MTIIYSKETVITFNENGDYRVIQDTICIAETAKRKDKIVRKRKLPNWCLKALDNGFWIEVSEFVPKGTNRNDFYLEIKGKSVKPQLFDEVEIKIATSFDEPLYHKCQVKTTLSRKVEGYKDFRKPMSFFEGWKIISKEIINGLLRSDFDKFKQENPLPKDKDEEYCEEFVETKIEYRFEENLAIKNEYDIVQPHTKGHWYSYEIDDNYNPYIRKNKLADNWSLKRILKNTKTLSYIKKDVISVHRQIEQSASYESEDGYRMTYDTTEYEITEYNVILSDNSEHRMSIRKWIKTY